MSPGSAAMTDARLHAIHQFHPVLAAHDATSDHLFAIRDLARSWGHPAEAYAIEAKP